MSQLIEDLKEIKTDLSSLDHQIEGAKYMVDEESPAHNFLNYLQRCLGGMHDKLGWGIRTHIGTEIQE